MKLLFAIFFPWQWLLTSIIETETRKKTAELLGTTCVILLFLKYDKAITYTKLFLEKTWKKRKAMFPKKSVDKMIIHQLLL